MWAQWHALVVDVSQQTTTTAVASSAMRGESTDADDGSSLSSVSFTNDGVTAKMPMSSDARTDGQTDGCL